jgi:hypothetical protein
MSVLCDPGLGSSTANNAFLIFSIINSLSVLILLYNHSACILSSVILLIFLCIEFACYNLCKRPELSPDSQLPLYVLSIQFTLLLQSLISVIQLYSLCGNIFEMTTIVLFLFIRIIHCIWMMGIN